MNAIVKVLSKEKFDDWYGDTTTVVSNVAEVAATPAAEGFAIMKTQGCMACHSSDGYKNSRSILSEPLWKQAGCYKKRSKR